MLALFLALTGCASAESRKYNCPKQGVSPASGSELPAQKNQRSIESIMNDAQNSIRTFNK